MTGKERILKAIRNEKPDHVPASPDLFEMVPLRLFGGKSWEALVYQDPPVWKMRANAYRYFGVDTLFAISVPMEEQRIVIVYKDEEKMITRDFTETEGRRKWSSFAMVYRPNEPSSIVKASSIGLPDEHDTYDIVKPSYNKTGKEYFEDVRAYVGDDGVVMPMVHLPVLSCWEDDVYRYYDDTEAVLIEKRIEGESLMKQAEIILSWKPDCMMIGNSGLLINNPPHIFRQLGLEWLKKVTRLAKEHGVPTHLHACGPERTLVEIAANETDLNCIEPLEISPMGDCNLKEIKEKFGNKIALKGNLHTTEIMLFGTPGQVEDSCKKAIDDAAGGGGFILSTGDQTPRDVPFKNIEIMQRVAETYGRY